MIETKLVVKVLIFNVQGQLLLIRRSETAPRRALEWDLPGGIVNDGENYEAAALREVKEETGLSLDMKDTRLLYSESKMYDTVNAVFLLFKSKTEVSDVTLSYEHDQILWTTIEDAVEKIASEAHQKGIRYILENNIG